MRHPNLLSKEKALLLIIDVQEKFKTHIKDFDCLLRAINVMVDAAKILDIPVVLTEQYPQGLGPTVKEISERLGKHSRFCKTTFSCCQQADFVKHLADSGRQQIIITGIETHVCVSQSAHDLLTSGFTPHLIVEAIGSRTAANKQVGIEKMTAAGAIISSLETALFEMLFEAQGEIFKAVQKLIK